MLPKQSDLFQVDIAAKLLYVANIDILSGEGSRRPFWVTSSSQRGDAKSPIVKVISKKTCVSL